MFDDDVQEWQGCYDDQWGDLLVPRGEAEAIEPPQADMPLYATAETVEGVPHV